MRSALAVTAVLVGCARLHTGTPVAVQPKPPELPITLKSVARARPDALPYSRALLDLGGTKIETALRSVRKGERLDLTLLCHGEALERERYRISPRAFGLEVAAEETFSPTLDLLRFPLRTGDHWSWKGSVSTGGIARPASAQIVTAPDAGNVRVDVAMRLIANPGHAPITRSLTFWFSPGNGLVKRRFEKVSTREAAP